MKGLGLLVFSALACKPSSPAEPPSSSPKPGPGAFADAATSKAAPEPPPPACGPDAEAEARELYQEGATHYRLGHYDEAATAFAAAHNCVPKAALLFNLAQAYERAGRLQDALDAFKRLSLDPTADASMAKRAREKVAELNDRLP